MAIRMTGLVSGMDTESIVKELMAAKRMKATKIEQKQTKLEWTQDKWKELNTKIYKLYTDSVSKMRLEGSYQTQTATVSDTSKADVTASANAPAGAHTLEVKNLASTQYVTGGMIKTPGITTTSKLKDLNMITGTKIDISTGTGNAAYLEIGDDTTIEEFIQKCKDAGLNASYDTTQERFFIGSQESGSAGTFTITSNGAGLDKLGLGEINGDAKASTNDLEMTVIKAEDAKIVLNGATLIGTSNSIVVNGLTINLKETTEVGEKISLNVSKDTKATYDMIKTFVTDYNEILKEMNDLYYADSARGYEPLSDEEKETMTDDQVEKWETKIKDSLLRRDSTLGTLTSTIKSTLASSIEIDGKNYSLASYGIMTSADYTEKGLLHIYGDKTDSTYSEKTDKLTAALLENPEQVAQVMAGIATKLYTTMTDSMKSTTLSSALTFYNDKQMAKQVTDYKKEVTNWEKRLEEMESRYYKQFTAMETALEKLNSQQSSLSSLLGM